MIDLDRIESLAKAATPGPWYVDQDDRPGMEWNRAIASDPNGDQWVCMMTHSGGKDDAGDEATAKYIAAASPDVVLRLVAVAKAVQAFNEADRTRPLNVQRLVDTCDAMREALAALKGVKHG